MPEGLIELTFYETYYLVNAMKNVLEVARQRDDGTAREAFGQCHRVGSPRSDWRFGNCRV